MIIKQVSVFLENKIGRLAEVTKALGGAKINISALSLAESEDFGVLRLIVNDEENALKALKNVGISAKITNVILVEISDTPGALSKIVEELSKENIDIAYMYGYSNDKCAPIIMKVSDTEKAMKILK